MSNSFGALLLAVVLVLAMQASAQFQGGQSSVLIFDHCAVDLFQSVTWLVDSDSEGHITYNGFEQSVDIIDFTSCGGDLVVQFNTEISVGASINNRGGAVRFTTSGTTQDVQVYLPDQRGWTSLTTLTPILTPAFYQAFTIGFSLGNPFQSTTPNVACNGLVPATLTSNNLTAFAFSSRNSVNPVTVTLVICKLASDPTCASPSKTTVPNIIASSRLQVDEFDNLNLIGTQFTGGKFYYQIFFCQQVGANECDPLTPYVGASVINNTNPLLNYFPGGQYHVLYTSPFSSGIYYDYFNYTLPVAGSGVSAAPGPVSTSPVYNDDDPISTIPAFSCCKQRAIFDTAILTNNSFVVASLIVPNANANYAPNPYNEQLFRIRIDVCSQQPFYSSYYCSRVGYYPNQNIDYDVLGTGVDVVYTDLKLLVNPDGSLLILLLGLRNSAFVEDHTFSHENYIVNTIYCTNVSCTQYTVTQLVDSLRYWNGLNFQAYPLIVGCSVGFSPASQNPVVTLSTFDGSPFLLYCLYFNCTSVSLVRTSDQLAGHYGDFGTILTQNSVLVVSAASWGLYNTNPYVYQFLNGVASPLATQCNSQTVGNFYSANGLVLLCTRVGDPILNAATIFAWVELGGRPRSYLADGNHFSSDQNY